MICEKPTIELDYNMICPRFAPGNWIFYSHTFLHSLILRTICVPHYSTGKTKLKTDNCFYDSSNPSFDIPSNNTWPYRNFYNSATLSQLESRSTYTSNTLFYRPFLQLSF